jgi:hypothetical protein
MQTQVTPAHSRQLPPRTGSLAHGAARPGRYSGLGVGGAAGAAHPHRPPTQGRDDHPATGAGPTEHLATTPAVAANGAVKREGGCEEGGEEGGEEGAGGKGKDGPQGRR